MAVTVADEEGVLCRSYTSARKHEKVTGVISGKAMPWTSTNTQLVTFIVTAVFLLVTRRWWGSPFPLMSQIPVLAGGPALMWWLARKVRPDHRSPGRALVSAVNFYLRPRAGRHRGQRARSFSPRLVGGGRVYFCGGPR